MSDELEPGSIDVPAVKVGEYRGWQLWASARAGICAAAYKIRDPGSYATGPTPIIRRSVAELITAIDDESEPF